MSTIEPALRFETLDQHLACVTLDMPNSRANTLNRNVQAEWESILDRLESQTDLHGFLLRSAKPGMFIAGADLNELAGSEPNSDSARGLVERFARIQARLEALPFPTCVLIDGSCVGGGLELSLAFDYRLVGTHPKAELGLPETKIGLIPGWGGSQRLPRVVGPELACEMIVSGDSISSHRAQEIGLAFDRVPSDQLLGEGTRILAWSKHSGDWKLRRQRMQRPIGLTDDQYRFTFDNLRSKVHAKTKGLLPAPLAAVEAIAEGCNLPLSDALAVEARYFLPLVGSEISRNLIAVFFMRQKLSKDPGVTNPDVKASEIKSAGVIGAGLMGSGIVAAHLRKGMPTVMVDADMSALTKGMQRIADVFRSQTDAGRLTSEQAATALALITPTVDRGALVAQDLLVEAVVENEAVKTTLLHELSRSIRPDAILASNTSTISITRLAEAVVSPERFAGFHFFNPVDRMPLVEVIRGEKTSDATIATLVAHAKRLGKSAIVVRDGPGFLVNRVLFPYLNEAMVLLEAGVSPRAIDRAAELFGMPMGPITLADLVGLDTMLFAGNVLHQAYAERSVQGDVLGKLVSAGRLGKKTGAGFDAYAIHARGAEDPALTTFLPPRGSPLEMVDDEIQDRLFLPMFLEATRVLDDGTVREAAEVDMGLILGLGFPAHRGGILRWADSVGLKQILEKLGKYEHLGARFVATEALRKRDREGRTFHAR